MLGLFWFLLLLISVDKPWVNPLLGMELFELCAVCQFEDGKCEKKLKNRSIFWICKSNYHSITTTMAPILFRLYKWLDIFFLLCFIRYTIQMPVLILYLLIKWFAFSFSCLTQFFMAFYQYQKNDFYVTGEVISF